MELEDLDPATLHIKKLGEVEDGEEPLQEIEEIPFDKIVRVSIFLDEPATLDAGYAIEGVGSNRSAVSYRESLRRQQAAVTAAIEKATGRALDVKWNMTLAVNAISANIRYGDMVKIGAVPGVKKVVLERQYEEPVVEEEPIAQEPDVEGPAEPVVEEETGTVENPAEPVEPGPIAAEMESAFLGSLNAVKGTVCVTSRGGNSTAIQSAGSATEDDNAITLKLTEDLVTTNGLITVTYDAGKLTYVESRSKLSRFSVHQADGTVTFAYAAEEATGIAAGTVLAELVFAEKEPNASTTIGIMTVERDEMIGSGETPVATDQVTLPLGPQFRTQNLVLSGKIGVNFFVDLDTLSDTEKRDSYMTFAISGSGKVTGRDDFNPNHMNATKKYYGFTAYVNSIQMADTITATYHYGDGLTVEKQYSVKEYLNTVEANKDKFSIEPLDLAYAIADYGHYAQIYLSSENNWSYGEDYATLEQFYTEAYDYDAVKAAVSGKVIVKNIDGTGIEAVTYKLYLDSGTELDVFLKPTDGVEVTASASFNGRTYPAEKQSDGRYCIRIKDISAHQLGIMARITGTAGGDFSVDVCVLSYVNAILNPGWSNDAKNTVCALYKYYEATMAYRQNS